MRRDWKQKIMEFIEANAGKAERLLKELAVLPAPSGKEERRAQFCLQWLREQGAFEAYIDSAGNVIYPYQAKHRTGLSIYMAHLDVVFPDEERLVIQQRERLLKGPGVSDDTANLVNLLMAAAFFAKEKPSLSRGILFVADTGEEGLGNLKGCRQLMADYGARTRQVVSFDLYLGQCFHQCVGSLRYEISIRTEGGHSFSAFGNENAIHQISKLVCALYEKEVPKKAQTTYNVGLIQGGTSVNTIAQNASILYEIRSVDADCLLEMKQFFESVIAHFQKKGFCLEVKEVGNRPCAKAMDEAVQRRQQELVQKTAGCILAVTGQEASLEAASTDANMPLSLGIPALTLGTIVGGGAHTREEWVDLDSQRQGMQLALELIFTLEEEENNPDNPLLIKTDSSQVRYEPNIICQGETLLEVIDKNTKKISIPYFIRRFADNAFSGQTFIQVHALWARTGSRVWSACKGKTSCFNH